MRRKIDRLAELVEQLKTVKLVEKKRKNGTYDIFYKSVILFEGLPETNQSEYIMRELGCCFSRIAGKFEQYIIESGAKVKQIEMDIFANKEETTNENH